MIIKPYKPSLINQVLQSNDYKFKFDISNNKHYTLNAK